MARYRRPLAIWLLLLCAALLPRIFTLDRPLTVDEAYFWQDRSAKFLSAVASGRFADTMITGHPGVTTMWLGSIGLLVERALVGLGLLAAPSYQNHLTLMRLPLASATALAIASGYLLLRCLVGERAALIAAFLWCSDPFLVAHSRLIHVDAVLTMLMLLAILALLAACFDSAGPRVGPRAPLLVLAGVASGLALVTKAPALLLFPIGALLLSVWYWQSRSTASVSPYLLIRAAAIWTGIALLTALAAWPALWVAPRQAINSVISEIIVNGGTQHPHNFLLGSDERNPGALFYLVTLLGRTTPWSAFGLMGMVLAVWQRWPWLHGRRTPLLLLACAALLILLALTAAPKKFDRYALPVIPLILVLAACGLLWLGTRLPALLRRGAGLIIAASASITLLSLHPYYLAYYSPLIGGSAYAPKTVPIGEGEGMDLAADWLNAQPDIASSVVATWSPPTIQPYLHTTATWWDVARRNGADYLVAYLYDTQTGDPYIRRFHRECEPLHTVRINGIDYAWIYRVPRQSAQPLDARFGDVLALSGSNLTPPNTACGESLLRVTFTLRPLTAPDQPVMLFVHLLGSDGRRAAQFDLPLATLLSPQQWHAGDEIDSTLELPLPANLPADRYHLFFGLYQPTTSKRLPLQSSMAGQAELAGPDALHIASFTLAAAPDHN